MRKIMKRRGRQSKSDSKENNKEVEDVANGDVVEKKRKSRSNKIAEENGKPEESNDKKVESDTRSDSESDEPERKKKKSGKKDKKVKESRKEKESRRVAVLPVSDSEEDSDAPSKSSNDEEDSEVEIKKKKGKKEEKRSKRKSEKTSKHVGNDKNVDDEEDYEVEAIVGDKKVRGVQQYRIRWKGYGSDQDTWEPERTLNCSDLLQKYKESKAKADKKKAEDDDYDETTEFEVDRILEVHFRRDGSREFLVHWKGYASNDSSWEPEENMTCKELIAKFMSKVEKAKEIDQRNLRTYRAPTERFTLNTKEGGRRLSKRNSQKQRIRYVDCE